MDEALKIPGQVIWDLPVRKKSIKKIVTKTFIFKQHKNKIDIQHR